MALTWPPCAVHGCPVISRLRPAARSTATRATRAATASSVVQIPAAVGLPGLTASRPAAALSATAVSLSSSPPVAERTRLNGMPATVRAGSLPQVPRLRAVDEDRGGRTPP